MTGDIYNTGVYNSGTIENSGTMKAGEGSSINVTRPSPDSAAAQRSGQGVDVGILTVITEETQAVAQVLGLEPESKNGLSFNCGTVSGAARPITVAACQMLKQGEHSVGSALEHLKRNFSPHIVVLTDIAGGIQPDARLGEVVISTRVVSYDLRKETPERVIRRGQEWQAPAEIGHAVNQFFADHGHPAAISGMLRKGTGNVRVHEGPVGSGNAVIAHRDSDIVKYLLAYNDKILHVDMESGGLAHALHDQPAAERPSGWLVIRGISDHADEKKNDTYRYIASFNAAATLEAILPYLPTSSA